MSAQDSPWTTAGSSDSDTVSIRRTRPAARIPLVLASACAVATVGIGVGAFEIDAVAAADHEVLFGFSRISARPILDDAATSLSHMPGRWQLAVVTALMLMVATLQGARRRAVALLIIIAGSNLTAQALQQVIEAPRYPMWLPDSIWPSGHTTAALSIAVCAVLIAPPLARTAVAVVGGVWVVAIAYAILVLSQHHPSDVLAAMLLTGAWTWLAIAACTAADDRPVPRIDPGLAVIMVIGPTFACALIALLVKVNAGAVPVLDRATFAGGAALLAACGLALPLAVAAWSRTP